MVEKGARRRESVPFAGHVLLAVSFVSAVLSGCQAANNGRVDRGQTEKRIAFFSTMDSSVCTPSACVSNHGPYRLAIEPPIWAVVSDGFLNDSSVRKLRERRRPYANDATRMDDLSKLVETIREAEDKFGPMSIFDRVLFVRDNIAKVHNDGDRDFRMTYEPDCIPGLKSDAELLGLWLESGTCCSHFDADDVASEVSSVLGGLFPEHGEGRVVRVQPVMTSTKDNGVSTTGSAQYLVTERGIMRRYVFLDYLVHAHFRRDWPRTMVSADGPFRVVGGKPFLAVGRQNVPLFDNASSDRQFVAALVNLLNGLSESDFDELEVSAW